ncbi:MAG: hypothetical protein NC217_03815 [Muribaculaceae bacterium]|nr:hypothetical protein [Muribaculaceae bacterium]
MKIRSISIKALLVFALVCSVITLAACAHNTSKEGDSIRSEEKMKKDDKPGGPQLGTPGGGPVIDKSGDATLQQLIKDVVPQFKQLTYKDEVTGKTMKYNLFTPKVTDKTKKYPLVLFIADATTPGDDFTTPLTQGYGGLIWAARQWQTEHPCYVLVPQFSGVAVNDAYEHTDEVDIVVRMIKSIIAENNVDTNRLYSTGQSMGGMISMYYDVAYPDMFAASIFVDSHWDPATFDELAKRKFVYFIAGDKGKAYSNLKPLEAAAEKDGVQYTFAEWSAKLPEERQSELAAAMLDKGAPINIFQFEPGSVLPADGKGSEHMYSFDYAYKIPSVKEWLFRQSK